MLAPRPLSLSITNIGEAYVVGGVGGDQVCMLLELRQADFFGLIETHPSVASVLYENMSDVVSTMRRGMRRRVVIQYRTVSCAV